MEFKVRAPLWLKYPNIPQGSIGWRMGYGEEYGSLRMKLIFNNFR
ncbi:hypothetical protein SAMN02745163_01377 [Clostridium cavendishii DSM 21758]|uniref:Uncharacterized protein n=1 Tax=Clostridium cavendishii DSM 21758 TaxID=1121302 RepID=A0A1M6GSY5_9CLOT|nr:hypothetical protein SAMN02745163_01377 [Clostridium cavendishii DSM 21758]